MTAKRFDIDDSDIVVDDLKTGESYIFDDYRSCENCCILLNELHEQVQSQVIVIKEYQERCDKLFEENQQLKYIIKEAYNTERTMIGKSVLKQLMERIGIE